ncbi:MAG: response regulator transcription factor [Dokdonia sp.]|jgi:two-component system nitrate/nitrite response regulator NarL
MRIRLAIAEDHMSFREGMALFLKYESDIELVGFAKNGKELLEIVRKKRPTVVVTDVRMPIMDGIVASQLITKEYPEVKIIAFTMFDQRAAIEQMLQAGAKGYILKNSSLTTLLEAVRCVAKGNIFYDSGIATQNDKKNGSLDRLTNRQKEILKLVTEGKSNPEIAKLLFIERSTVETHRKNMIQKLGLSGPGELLRYGLQKRYEF